MGSEKKSDSKICDTSAPQRNVIKEDRKRQLNDVNKDEAKHPKIENDKDKSLGDIVSDIIDDIMGSPKTANISTKPCNYYKEDDLHRIKKPNPVANDSEHKQIKKSC